jgi:hypothetical protein
MQQALAIRPRVLDPDDLPSYRFPWVARRLLFRRPPDAGLPCGGIWLAPLDIE